MSDGPLCVNNEIKCCPRCNTNLKISEFGVSRARRDGRNIYCKRCNRERTNSSRQTARERQAKQLGMKGGSNHSGIRKSNTVCDTDDVRQNVGDFISPTDISAVDRVKEAIRTGPKTQKQLLEETKLTKDEIGDALADLLLWTHEVATRTVGEIRLYFLRSGHESSYGQHQFAVRARSTFDSDPLSSFSSVPFFLPGKDPLREPQKNNSWVAD